MIEVKVYIEEMTAFSTDTRKTRSSMQNDKLDPCVSPSTKIRFMFIKELNFKHETLKLLEERADYMLEGTGIG